MPREDTQFKPGNRFRFQPGQSGNPVGVSKLQQAFGNLLADCLAGKGTPDELAELVWKAARDREPWAIQLLFSRLAPEIKALRLVHSTEDKDGQFDFTRLSDAELGQMEGLLERAALGPGDDQGGEGAA